MPPSGRNFMHAYTDACKYAYMQFRLMMTYRNLLQLRLCALGFNCSTFPDSRTWDLKMAFCSRNNNSAFELSSDDMERSHIYQGLMTRRVAASVWWRCVITTILLLRYLDLGLALPAEQCRGRVNQHTDVEPDKYNRVSMSVGALETTLHPLHGPHSQGSTPTRSIPTRSSRYTLCALSILSRHCPLLYSRNLCLLMLDEYAAVVFWIFMQPTRNLISSFSRRQSSLFSLLQFYSKCIMTS